MSIKPKTFNLFLENLFSRDDITLKKFLEVDAFGDVLSAIYAPELKARRAEVITEQSHVITYATETLVRDDPKRVRAILKLLDFLPKDGFVAVPDELQKTFPFNLMLEKPGQVRELTNKKYADLVSGKNLETDLLTLALPGKGSQFYQRPPAEESLQKSYREVVLEALNKIPGGGQEVGILTSDEMKTVIDVLSFEINDVGRISELLKISARVKQDLVARPVRSISLRGNLVEITDPALVELGYEAVLFENAKVKPQIKATVIVGEGGYQIPVLINEEKNVVDPKTGEPLSRGAVKSDYASAKWFEAMILSHLHELTCKEALTRENMTVGKRWKGEGGGDTDGAEGIEELEKEYTTRVGHLRRLDPKESYSETQVQLAWEEQGWYLVQINELRERLNLPRVTYVRIVDRVSLGDTEEEATGRRMNPVGFKAQDAMVLLDGLL